MAPSIISGLLGGKKDKSPDSALTVGEGIVGCAYAPKLTSLDYHLNATIKIGSKKEFVSASINPKGPGGNHSEIRGTRASRIPSCSTISDIYSPIYCQEPPPPAFEYDYVNPRDRRDSASRSEFDETPLTEESGGRYAVQRVLKTVILYLVGLLVFEGMLLVYALSLIYRQFVKLLLICVYGDRLWLIERPADALWGYEAPSSSSNIVFVLKVKGVPDINRILEDFERKVLHYRTLLRADQNADGIYRMYTPYKKLGLIIRRKLLFFCWEKDEDFNLRNHFFMEKVMDDGNNLDERIEAVCEAYLEYKLDPNKPQWEFRIIAPVGPRHSSSSDYGLVFCVHHSYGDGLSWLQMFRHCLADETVNLPIDPMKSPKCKPSSRSPKITVVTNFFEKIGLLLCLPFAFASQMARMGQESNGFHGPSIRGAKKCCWTKTRMSLERIKGIRTKNGNSVLFSSVVLACVGKAFQRAFHHYGCRIPTRILAGSPYAKLPYKSLEPLNRFTMALFELPTRVLFNRNLRLGLTDNTVRQYSSRKYGASNYMFTNMAGALITPLFKLSTLVAKTTVGMTNLPGPSERLYLFGGQAVDNFLIYAPMKFRTGVNVGVFSYCGKVTLSLAVDGSISEKYPKFSENFIGYLEKEMEVLVRECGDQNSEIYESIDPDSDLESAKNSFEKHGKILDENSNVICDNNSVKICITDTTEIEATKNAYSYSDTTVYAETEASDQ